MATKSVRFKVDGIGDFPFDMLRYDACYPATSEDASRLSERPSGLYRIGLIAHTSLGAPTVGRWNSFGWRVVK